MIDVVDRTVQKQILHSTEEDAEAWHGSSMRYLVVSCGYIFSVQIKFLGRPYDGALTGIVVHRFDSSDSMWKRVESIGRDYAFLISGDYGFSCTTAVGQLQGNCVYLVWSSCDRERLYKFCLDDMTISFDQFLPEPTTPCTRAYWVVSDK